MIYKYKVILSVEVDAFDESDAFDIIQDNFGLQEDFGVSVTDCEYIEV